MLIVDVDHSNSRSAGSAALEQNLLSGKIPSHVVVVVEVVPRKIRKYRNIERDTVSSFLCKRVRRNLHHRFGCTLVQSFAEQTIELEGFRRSVRSSQSLSGDVIFDGSNQSTLPSRG